MLLHTCRFALAALIVLVGACSTADTLAPEERQPSDLKLLTVPGDAPPLAATTVSFWAVRGRGADVELWYRARPGRRDSSRFLEFKLNGNSLDRRPDGSLIAQGDSVRITLTVRDPLHLIVDFEPSGLRFTSKDPARLRMYFAEVGDDLDHDGHVGSEDDDIERRLSIWRQEAVGLPWIKTASVTVKESREVDADLSGFTGYALSY
jgi:hypothetical protein